LLTIIPSFLPYLMLTKQTYKIQPGDTLSRVAAAQHVSLSDLRAANQQITNPDLVQVGELIYIPEAPVVAPSDPTPDGVHPAPNTISTFNIDTDTFFKKIQPFFGSPLTPGQEQNMKVLLTLGAPEVNSLEAMAYVLATVRREAGPAMAPRAEIGEGHGYPYGQMLDMGHMPYTTPNQIYYGRGHVQLTWRSNYVAMGELVAEDLLNHPDLMLSVAVSARVAIKGMTRGSFTGKKLADYFGPGQTPDPINARRIINGEDDAPEIAEYYTHFLAALQAAHQTAIPPAPQVAVVVGTPAQVASVAEALASAPTSAAEASAAPGLVTAVLVAAPVPAAEEPLATPALVADVSAPAPDPADTAIQV
jgi:putative chitinase